VQRGAAGACEAVRTGGGAFIPVADLSQS
jgi:hypothetical protein